MWCSCLGAALCVGRKSESTCCDLVVCVCFFCLCCHVVRVFSLTLICVVVNVAVVSCTSSTRGIWLSGALSVRTVKRTPPKRTEVILTISFIPFSLCSSRTNVALTVVPPTRELCIISYSTSVHWTVFESISRTARREWGEHLYYPPARTAPNHYRRHTRAHSGKFVQVP